MNTDEEIYSEGYNLALQEGYEGANAKEFARNYVEGYKIGLEKGEAIGLEKGEHKKAVKVARKALEMGMSVEDACELSGLSKEQINELIK